MRTYVATLGSIVAVFMLFIAGPAMSGQEQFITPDFLRIHTEHDAKHTAKLTAPATVAAGEWFDVTISLGADALHPSLSGHSVMWVALYAGDVEIARSYFHPVMSKPQVTWTIALAKSTTLRVLAMPNHAGPYEARRAIKVRPAG